MTFHAGNKGLVTVNGVELPTVNWSVDPAIDIQRFANSKTAGFRKKEGTYKDATFSAEIDYDFDLNPFGVTGGNLQIGNFVTNVRLYLNTTSGPYWHFPSAIVTSTPQRSENEGKITTTVNFEADGAFTPPA